MWQAILVSYYCNECYMPCSRLLTIYQAIDFTIYLLPAKKMWTLRVPRRQKALIAVLFALGGLCVPFFFLLTCYLVC